MEYQNPAKERTSSQKSLKSILKKKKSASQMSQGQISFDSGPGVAVPLRPSSSSRDRIIKQIMQFNQSLKMSQQEVIHIIDQKHHSALPPQLDQKIDNMQRQQEESSHIPPLQPRGEVARGERRGLGHYKGSLDYQLLQNKNFIYSELPSSARERSYQGNRKGRSSLQVPWHPQTHSSMAT